MRRFIFVAILTFVGFMALDRPSLKNAASAAKRSEDLLALQARIQADKDDLRAQLEANRAIRAAQQEASSHCLSVYIAVLLMAKAHQGNYLGELETYLDRTDNHKVREILPGVYETLQFRRRYPKEAEKTAAANGFAKGSLDACRAAAG